MSQVGGNWIRHATKQRLIQAKIRSFHDQETRGTQPKSETSAVRLSCPHHLSCTLSRTKKKQKLKTAFFFGFKYSKWINKS